MRVCDGLNRSWQSCKSKWYTSSITNIVTDSKRITTRSSQLDRRNDKHHQDQNENSTDCTEKNKSIRPYQRRNGLFHSSSYFNNNDEIKINHEKNVVKCYQVFYYIVHLISSITVILIYVYV
jgi:hypothetical protein